MALVAGALLMLSSAPVVADDAPVVNQSADVLSVDPDVIATMRARVTFYVLSGITFSSEHTRPGVAACSWDLPIYTRLRMPDGRVVTCLDRGILGNGYPVSWVDIYATSMSWGHANVARAYGDYANVEVLA